MWVAAIDAESVVVAGEGITGALAGWLTAMMMMMVMMMTTVKDAAPAETATTTELTAMPSPLTRTTPPVVQ